MAFFGEFAGQAFRIPVAAGKEACLVDSSSSFAVDVAFNVKSYSCSCCHKVTSIVMIFETLDSPSEVNLFQTLGYPSKDAGNGDSLLDVASFKCPSSKGGLVEPEEFELEQP